MRRRRASRIAAFASLVLLGLVIVALVAAWVARRPIASNLIEREFAQRGVEASYSLDRVGLRTQEVSNLVIGDPKRPDLTARFAQIQVRITWNGSVEVYRIVARGVRLRGRVVRNRVSWGEVDKLLPPPSGKPFQLPNFVLDIADSTISLATPYGGLGFALAGSGNLTGGFKGRLSAFSPRLIPGRCRLDNLRAQLRVEVEARRPHLIGPVRLDRLNCPRSRLAMVEPLFNIDSRFNEAFTSYDGSGRMAIRTFTAGDNGLAALNGKLTFSGDPEATYGTVELAAQRSRLAAIFAERTRLAGKYRLGLTGGTLVLVGDYAANSAVIAPAMLTGLTGPLASARNTPLGEIATAIGGAITRTARNFDASGELRVVNFTGGGAVRIASAEVRGPNGAKARVSGGDGVTYYWPTGRIRIDGQIEMGGGGLPAGRVNISQPRGAAAMSGTAEFQPYRVANSRLALAPIRFAAARDGSTQVNTVALLDGAFPDGRVQGLRLPINARFGGSGGFALGQGCLVGQFTYLKMRALQLGPTRLPICPIGPAILSQRPGGALQIGARSANPRLKGRLGKSPLDLAAASVRIFGGRRFDVARLAMRLGRAKAPIRFNATALRGTFAGSGVNGTFAGADALIGNVPLQLSEGAGRWRVNGSNLAVDAALAVTDRNPNPRFYPLNSDDVRFTLGGDWVRANGTLKHPASGTKVTDVAIEHRLSTGAGHAILDVPGIRFGQGLQPEELTRLTEGVIALVEGNVFGRGRIDWNGTKVTSTGDFSTDDLNLAAAFGPVSGIKGTVHFDDLLALSTPAGQSLQIASINPGILVENGAIRFQLLPGQLVRVERGEWPFMGGRLILQETILNFSRPTAKRLTFEVVGLDANAFVGSMGFKEIGATGIFDGVLPMIFDEAGVRIVGGRLDSRAPGGTLSYNGVVNRANLGMMGGIAFDALKNLRYRSMIVRLDGDLAGEFATRLTIEQFGLGDSKAARVLGAFNKIPFRFNVTIKGPFRALIATAKAFRDPRQMIRDVLPVPLDEVPGIVTEVRRRE
ncbi:MAG: YdbH domain-containing protein, partial [Sphingomicrobium sp.]